MARQVQLTQLRDLDAAPVESAHRQGIRKEISPDENHVGTFCLQFSSHVGQEPRSILLQNETTCCLLVTIVCECNNAFGDAHNAEQARFLERCSGCDRVVRV